MAIKNGWSYPVSKFDRNGNARSIQKAFEQEPDLLGHFASGPREYTSHP